MKKLAQATAFLLGLTTSVLTSANEPLPMIAVCKSIEESHKFLNGTYNEQPFAGGESIIRMPDGRLVEGTGKVYVDPGKKGFTFLIEFEKIDKSCVLLMGDNFAPLQQGDGV